MRPVDIQVIGDELALKWADGREDFIKLEWLRRACPCAACRGEPDILGHIHKGPERPLTAESFGLVQVRQVGGYALQPIWADGHDSGLYAYDYLQDVAAAQATGGDPVDS